MAPEAIDGKIERKNGSIVLLDDTGEEKMRWNFRAGLADQVDRAQL